MRPSLRTVNFHEVGFSASKAGKCCVCGKPCRRTQKFFQTLNPWNKNAEGEPKTSAEIIAELRVKAAEWRAKPVCHVKCEVRK